MRNSSLVAATAAVCLLSLAGCASLPPAPTDALSISGPTLGKRELRPDACYSGEHWVFLGAQVEDSKSKIGARLVIDPVDGPIVRAFAIDDADQATFSVRRKDCIVFETNLERTGNWNNFVSEVGVELKLDCETSIGDRVRGTVSQKPCK
jgi:hypothetical protein